jgi:hypothetical protein
MRKRQEFAGKPMVVGLTGAQRQPYREAIGIHERLNFARQPPRDRPIAAFGHIAPFRCAAEFGRYRGIADSGEPSAVTLRDVGVICPTGKSVE